MILVLGQSLNLSVIAEGVETEAQQRFLAERGCHAYLGYLFGRPMSSVGYEAYLRGVCGDGDSTAIIQNG